MSHRKNGLRKQVTEAKEETLELRKEKTKVRRLRRGRGEGKGEGDAPERESTQNLPF